MKRPATLKQKPCGQCEEYPRWVECSRCDGLGSRDDRGIDDEPCHHCESQGGWWECYCNRDDE